MSTSIAPETVADDSDELAPPITADVATDGEESEPVEDVDDEDEEDLPEQEAETDGDESPEAAPAPAEAPAAEVATHEPAVELEPVEIPDANGQPYRIPGVSWDGKTNSLKFADDRAATRLHTLLKHGVAFESTRGKYEKQEQRHATELEAAKAEATDFMDALFGLADLSEDAAIQRFLEFRAGAPELRVERMKADYERRLAIAEGRDKEPQGFPDVPEARVQEWAEQRAAARIDADFQSKQYPWMTEKAAAHLKQVMASPAAQAQYVVLATAEDVRANPRLQLGEPFIHRDRWDATMNTHAIAWHAAYMADQEAKATARKQVQALGKPAAQNAKILAHATPPATKSAAVAPPTNRPKTRQELDAELAEARGELTRNVQKNPRRHAAGAGLF